MSERGEILGEAMRDAGIDRSELARISGIGEFRLGWMIQGRAPLRDDDLVLLLSCLGLTIEAGRRPVRAQMTRSVRRSWLLHRHLARDLDAARVERWAPRIIGNIAQMRGQIRGEPHRANLERWANLVRERDLDGLRRVLVGLDEDGIQMREVSPMRGLLSPAEREAALGHAA